MQNILYKTTTNLHMTTIIGLNLDIGCFYICENCSHFSMKKINYNRIKAVLAERDISSKELAKHLERTESTVSRWCTNDVQPSIEVLYEVAKYLDVDIRELLVSTK
jgi:putative transcriptional regulator